MFPHRRFSRWLLACLALLALAACGSGGGGGWSKGGKGVTTPVGNKPVIVATAPFGVSESCPNGGVRVDWGIDKNGNGTLDPGEITGGGDVCNGGNGQPMVAEAVPFTGTGGPCLNGGVRIDMGLDLDGDTGLGEGEITDHAYICDGAAGIAALIVTDVEPPGAHCAYGGLKIRSGQDTNGNLSLDDETGVSTNYVCNIGNMPLIQVLDAEHRPLRFEGLPLGISTWDRIDRWDGETWLTAGEADFPYNPYILVNNSDEERAFDVVVSWSIDAGPGALGGNLAAFAYPFNPLTPANPGPIAWNTAYWRYASGWNEDEYTNVVPVTLGAHESTVVVASADTAGVAASMNLILIPYTRLDASTGTATATGQSVAKSAWHAYKATGFAGQSDMNPPTPVPIRISMSGMTDTADLSAVLEPFSAFNIEPQVACSANGTNPACKALYADGDGNLWISVFGSGAGATASYDLTVTLPTDQGTAEVPIGIGTAADPFPASVGLGTSYYLATLPIGHWYNVRILNPLPADASQPLTLVVEAAGQGGDAFHCDTAGAPPSCYVWIWADGMEAVHITLGGSATAMGLFYDIKIDPLD